MYEEHAADKSGEASLSRRNVIGVAALCASSIGVGLGALPLPARAQDADLADINPTEGKYTPVDPVLVSKTNVFKDGSEVEVFWQSMAEPVRRAELSNQDAKVTVEKIENGVSVGYLDANASAGKGSYRVTVDYIRFKDELVTQAGSIIGRGKVGVGVRVTANVVTRKSGINLGGLLPIAFQYNRSYLSGDLEIKVIGIVSPEVAKIISTPTDLNEGSISKAMESFGAFRVVVDAADTRTVPHLLAINRNSARPIAEHDVIRSLGSLIS